MEKEQNAGNGKSILFIDDEEINRFTGSELLQSLGYSVLTAENGIAALEIYKEKGKNIDLVITDMIMPGMDGIETIKSLLAINGNCRVILISGFGKQDQSEEVRQLNISGFIKKPFSLSNLSKTVSEALS